MICGINLSEKGRRCMIALLLMFHLTIVICGMVHFGFGVYIHVELSNLVNLISENYNSLYLGNFVIAVALTEIIFHSISLKLCYNCFNAKSKGKWLLPALFIYFAMIWLMVSFIVICKKQENELLEVLKTGLKTSLKQYGFELEAKKEIDNIQMKQKCCGSGSYEDWLRFLWIPKEYVSPERRQKDDILEEFIRNNSMTDKIWYNPKYNTRGVPFSCCDSNVKPPCYHKHIMLPREKYKFDPDNHSFHKDGCAKVVSNNLRKTIGRFGSSGFYTFTILWFVMVCTLYLRTSMASAAGTGEYTNYVYPSGQPPGPMVQPYPPMQQGPVPYLGGKDFPAQNQNSRIERRQQQLAIGRDMVKDIRKILK